MFHLNRQEQGAVLMLCATLLAGTAVALIDSRHPERLETFRVLPGAVEAPAAMMPAPVEPAEPVVIDINRAAAADLEQLPRVGPKTAAAIVAHRQAHGPFRRLADLEAVRGIGPATVAGLRDHVRLD